MKKSEGRWYKTEYQIVASLEGLGLTLHNGKVQGRWYKTEYQIVASLEGLGLTLHNGKVHFDLILIWYFNLLI